MSMVPSSLPEWNDARLRRRASVRGALGVHDMGKGIARAALVYRGSSPVITLMHDAVRVGE